MVFVNTFGIEDFVAERNVSSSLTSVAVISLAEIDCSCMNCLN